MCATNNLNIYLSIIISIHLNICVLLKLGSYQCFQLESFISWIFLLLSSSSWLCVNSLLNSDKIGSSFTHLLGCILPWERTLLMRAWYFYRDSTNFQQYLYQYIFLSWGCFTLVNQLDYFVIFCFFLSSADLLFLKQNLNPLRFTLHCVVLWILTNTLYHISIIIRL
jgi:hypothetical protein